MKIRYNNATMLEYNQITAGKYIILDGDPYEILTSQTSKKSRQKASNQTKLKNVISGSVTEKAFHQSDKVEEAELEKIIITYLYHNKGEYWFCEEGNPKNRFQLDDEHIGEKGQYLKENTPVESLVFNEKVIGITLPIKMDLKVVQAPPGIKGNTVQGGSKQVELETGATISTPLFINEGDIIRVNTETNSYVERVEKS